MVDVSVRIIALWFIYTPVNLFVPDHIKALVVDLLDELGTDEHESDCEHDCDLLVTNQVHQQSLGTIGHSACPLVCHS